MENGSIESLNIPHADNGRVVIVGNGFAGIEVAKTLKRSNLQIVLIDRNNYHQFPPLLYQVATSGLDASSITFPIRTLISKYKNLYFRMAIVTGLDKESNTIMTNMGSLYYDHLILAAGADTNFFGMENVEKNSFPLKSAREAITIRNHIYKTLEATLDISDPELKQTYLNFVIVGGGATGVEVAGALAELRKYILPKDFPELDFSQMNIYLINAGERLLEAFSPKSSGRTLKDLGEMGVEVWLSTAVNDYKENIIYCDNGSRLLSTATLIWASGIKAINIEGVDAKGRAGRIKVDQFNLVEGFTNVYAAGDIAIMSPISHPQVAQVAIQQGRNVGKNLLRLTKNREPLPFVYKDKGSMATIGRNRAVAEIWGTKLGGFSAWVLWLIVHLLSIISVRNRFRIMAGWAWNYIAKDQPYRSIIHAKRPGDK